MLTLPRCCCCCTTRLLQVPRGREAEFFGVYFVAIKACSWVGPLACALINELTGSLRLAVLSALAFYVPSVVILLFTDFEEARREAEEASHTPRPPKMAHSPQARFLGGGGGGTAKHAGAAASEAAPLGPASTVVGYGTSGYGTSGYGMSGYGTCAAPASRA